MSSSHATCLRINNHENLQPSDRVNLESMSNSDVRLRTKAGNTSVLC